MIKPTNQLIFEVLKSVQSDIAGIQHTLADHGQQLINLRDQMHSMHRNLQTQIHDLQGDVIRLEKSQIALAQDVDLIKRRLNLVEAE